jgi:predicted PolB exonuclease-like 3'-5' exonuclease
MAARSGAWQAGRSAEIRDYCETDALNTYLVSLRFRLMRGELSCAEYEQEIAFVRAALEQIRKAALAGVPGCLAVAQLA